MNRCIIFDLDGTLIDSRADIANAINRTRVLFGFPMLPQEQIVSFTGDGVRKLIERSFSGTDIDIDAGITAMNRYYAERPAVCTTLYPGVRDGLQTLHDTGWKLGLVSNKPSELCRIIFRHFQLEELFCEIIGGSSGFPLKPAPEAMLHIVQKTNSSLQDSWVCGDNHTDMNAAKNAGMHGAFAAYGFGTLGEAKYDLKINSFSELPASLGEKYNGRTSVIRG